ncbi:MAG: Xaa-Pro peptidase family protein [Candidatus Micrarchaeia archaeon]
MDARLKRFFAASKAHALLLHNGDAARMSDPNMYYFLRFDIDSSFLIVRRDGEQVLLTSPMNYEYAKEKFSGRVERAKGSEVWKKLAEELRGCRSVSLNKRCLPASTYSKLLRMRKRLHDCSRELLELRARKDGEELSLIQRACAITRTVFESVRFRVGKTEEEMAREAEIAMLEQGAHSAFFPIIQSGPNARFPHSPPTRRRWKRGEILLVDLGARWQGYCSDLTRCFFSGKCREERETYEKLREINRELMKYLRPGTPAGKVATLATELFEQAGLPHMPHSIGHGVGLEVHEHPSLRKGSRAVLEAGNVVALEPAVYGKKFGARFEETVLVTKGGGKTLASF